MYDLILSIINAGSYRLEDILHKIDVMWVNSRLTDEEREQLITAARSNARSEYSHQSYDLQIDALAKRISMLEALVKKPEAAPEITVDEYPSYVSPTGAHDAYHAGDKVTYSGVKYTCIAPEGVAVVWAPDVYPDYWQTVTEEDTV